MILLYFIGACFVLFGSVGMFDAYFLDNRAGNWFSSRRGSFFTVGFCLLTLAVLS